ncbi:hypothetical protein C8Q76DRAFT_160082 [Earliella scabrosa]|nr:hypothetical protein C8Q76DRAFT_160082 [Earliella scabrosa]
MGSASGVAGGVPAIHQLLVLALCRSSSGRTRGCSHPRSAQRWRKPDVLCRGSILLPLSRPITGADLDQYSDVFLRSSLVFTVRIPPRSWRSFPGLRETQSGPGCKLAVLPIVSFSGFSTTRGLRLRELLHLRSRAYPKPGTRVSQSSWNLLYSLPSERAVSMKLSVTLATLIDGPRPRHEESYCSVLGPSISIPIPCMGRESELVVVGISFKLERLR